MNATHIVIGSGALGRGVAATLVAQGLPVRILSRSGSPAVAGADSRRVDASNAAALREALTDAAVVYQCARPPYTRWSADFRTLHETILSETAHAGADLVIADNLYAYGDPHGATLTENSREEPSTTKGVLRQSLADTSLAAHRDGRLRVAVVRAADFFGPGHDESSEHLFAAAAHGRAMRFVGRMDQPRSMSFVPDVAAAMAAIGTSNEGWGRVWIAPVQPAMTQAEFADKVWAAAGRQGPPRTRTIGRRAITLLSPFWRLGRELREMLYLFERPFLVDSSQFEKAFGMHPTPVDTAIAHTAEHYTSLEPKALPARPHRAWRRTVNATAAFGVAIVLGLGVGAGIDIANFDRTSGGYEAPYEGWTGTLTDWSAGAVTQDGFRNPGIVLDTLFNCTTGMISVETFGWTIDFRVVSERGVAVHKPIESCVDAGFEPDFVPTPGA